MLDSTSGCAVVVVVTPKPGFLPPPAIHSLILWPYTLRTIQLAADYSHRDVCLHADIVVVWYSKSGKRRHTMSNRVDLQGLNS